MEEFVEALFLEAALRMRLSMDDISVLTTTLDYLLRIVGQSTLPCHSAELRNDDKVLEFLHDTIITLIRRNRPGELEHVASHMSTSDTISRLYVNLGNTTLELSLKDILPCF